MISLIALYCIIRIMRSEAFARRFGALTGRLVRWFYGIARRKPSDEDFVEATLRFREGIAETWRERGYRVSRRGGQLRRAGDDLRPLGPRRRPRQLREVPIGAIAVVYTAVRLLTIVNFTPGGVGVTEALYTTALLTVTDGADQSQVVAAVFLFRGLTYIGPILLGAVSLLIWRFRSSWRSTAPSRSRQASVGSVLADRDPPTPCDATRPGGSSRAGRRRRSGRSTVPRNGAITITAVQTTLAMVVSSSRCQRCRMLETMIAIQRTARMPEEERQHQRTTRGRAGPSDDRSPAVPHAAAPRRWVCDARSLGDGGPAAQGGPRRG